MYRRNLSTWSQTIFPSYEVKGKMKLIFVEILKELKASGYHVSARLMNAMYFGVPPSRQRMIFVGVREDLWSSIQAP
jgi:site-specific DNA-cytosine methylase